jgi:pimeloyl-ACP methyl ester carboxylesterase
MAFKTARTLLLLLALSAFVTGCGDAVTSEPSPEVVATAEAEARDITIIAPVSTTPTSDDDDKQPISLDGRLFGRGETGVILAHMRPADQTSWYPFAQVLADTGRYTVMTFDFRGYGDSTGEKQFDRIDTDLEAAYEYMRDVLGFDRVFLVGASMGGTASLVVGSRVPVEGVISISSPEQFPPIDATLTVGGITAPKLFVSSEDDVPAMRAQEKFWDLASTSTRAARMAPRFSTGPMRPISNDGSWISSRPTDPRALVDLPCGPAYSAVRPHGASRAGRIR